MQKRSLTYSVVHDSTGEYQTLQSEDPSLYPLQRAVLDY